ncbi:MAG: hypothetical protein HN348_08480 [Proteobacteria bacterium]|nr:hypothetical protein [Pseudomonadota bacterium]
MLYFLLMMFLIQPALSDTPATAPPSAEWTGALFGPLDKAKDKAKQDAEKELEKLTEEQKKAREEAEERRKAYEAAQMGKASRVVVLGWPATDVTYKNEVLQQNVKTRIARPGAKFYPEIDLYQAGRREPDRSIHPIDQRGTVPSTVIPLINDVVSEVEYVAWDAMDEQAWGLKAEELRDMIDEHIWFVDREELREPLFKLYAMIGYASENSNTQAPPFFEYVGSTTLNYYYYLAAVYASEDSSLLDLLSNEDIKETIRYLRNQIDDGDIPPMTLSFENAGVFDGPTFASEYEVFINGRSVEINDNRGLHDVPPGRIDVYMKRSDGHSLSDRVELDKLNEKIYGVRDTARQRMGNDFIKQLMEHPNECTPDLSGDILKYLAIYAMLHPEAEVYIAIPELGNINKVLLWRWKRSTATLSRVLENGNYPIRFALVVGAGASYSLPKPNFGGKIELRGHYNRLLTMFGLEYTSELFELVYIGIGGVLGKNAALGFGPRAYLRLGHFDHAQNGHGGEASLHLGTTLQLAKKKRGRMRPLFDTDFQVGAAIGSQTMVQIGGSLGVGTTF